MRMSAFVFVTNLAAAGGNLGEDGRAWWAVFHIAASYFSLLWFKDDLIDHLKNEDRKRSFR